MDSISLQEERIMHRFYADPHRSDTSRFFLTAEDAHHAVGVLRLHPGDTAEVFFRGDRWLCELSSCGQDVILIPREKLASTEPFLSITLFQGLPKGDKMEWIVQKTVELGIFRIVPVAFSRCVVKLNDKDGERKRERWQKIAREAGKQSGRCIVPEVFPPVSISSLPDYFSQCDRVTVPWEECSGGGPKSFFARNPSLSSLGIVIGPEGGISGEEMDFFTSLGCEPVTLGKRILRTETAALAAVSVFSGLYGEME